MNKRFIIGLLIISIVIVPLGDVSVYAGEDKYRHFPHETLLDNKKREDEKIDTKKFTKFLALDEKYLLNTKLSKTDLTKEIAYLDRLLFENEENYVVTKKGAILYPPNIVGNINVYNIAKRNRKTLMNKGAREKFEYDMDIFYYPQKAVKGQYGRNINPDRLLETYKQTKIILDNIDIEKRYLENLVVSIAPFKMVGINGFTEPFGNYNEGTTLVIGKEVSSLPADSDAFREEIKSTVLHELGHVFHYVANRSYVKTKGKINLNTPFWNGYSRLYDNKLEKTYNAGNTKGWDMDIAENFAEDFRVLFSNRLGKHSFKPKPKRTKFEYASGVDNYIIDYMKKGGANDKPSINKSTAFVNGEEIPIDKYYVLDLSKNADINIEIEVGKIKKDSYFKVWSDSMTELERVELSGDKVFKYKIPANSNISTIVKYEKMGLDFVPLWRINIVR